MMIKVYKDQQGNLRTPQDVGATYVSPEYAVTLGWEEVSPDYQPPTPAPDKSQQIAALDAEYEPQFVELARAWANANMDGNTTLATANAAERAVLKEEYEKRREGLENG